MADEQKETENKECKCFFRNDWFKKFLTIALGTFVGFYCALTLFAATHKPPMPPCGFGPQGGMRGCPVKVIHQHFNKPMPNGADFQRPEKFQQAPFESHRPLPRK